MRAPVVLFTVISLIIITGCKDYKPEMEQALYERDSVVLMSEAKDSSIEAFIETLTEIEVNLDSITQSQEAITEDASDKVEFNKDIRERISYNITVINDLLNRNNELINKLNEDVRKSKINISALNKKIARLNEQITMKNDELAFMNTEITSLKGIIDSLHVSIDSLNRQSADQNTVIENKTNQLNTAFWTIGTYKELETQRVIDKKGGFLGLGKAQILKSDFNTDAFNQIDITKITKFDINSKSAKIITNHPTDSYTITKDLKGKILQLEVTDPARFWKASKYLVIVTG